MRSSSKLAARRIVNTGSIVESVDACVGPMRASPAKNNVIAATVEISAMPATAAQPALDRETERERGGDDECDADGASAPSPARAVLICRHALG